MTFSPKSPNRKEMHMHTYTFKLDDGTTYTCRAKGFYGAYVALCKDRNRDFKGITLLVKEDDGNFNQV